jgi:hypothetical protein
VRAGTKPQGSGNLPQINIATALVANSSSLRTVAFFHQITVAVQSYTGWFSAKPKACQPSGTSKRPANIRSFEKAVLARAPAGGNWVA